jgi:hypothetical protein
MTISESIDVQVAGEPVCAPSPSPEALLIHVPSRHESTRGDTPCSVSLSVPASPSGLHLAQLGMPPLPPVNGEGAVPPSKTKLVHHSSLPQLLNQARHHSQPTLVVRDTGGEAPAVPRSDSTRERDRRFDHFKTFSGRLERQLSALRGQPQEPLPDAVDIERGHGAASKISEEDTDEEEDVPSADRYFAALEGPELETLRVSTT